MTTANPSVKPDTNPDNLSVRLETQSVVDRVAAMLSRSRTLFMIQAARRPAEDSILDHTLISVNREKDDALVHMLDCPTQPNARLRALTHRTLR